MKSLFFFLLAVNINPLLANESIERGIQLFNQQDYTQAQIILEKESRKGSAHATYWLGVVQYNNLQHFEAGSTFLKAAEMGSPWAMAIMAGEEFNANSPCSYLGWTCDKEWKKKAISGWEKLAKENDGKAIFALAIKQFEWWEVIPIYKYKRHKENYTIAFENNGYGFLNYNSYWESQDEWIKYNKIAANQGYAPAMTNLYYHMDIIGLDEADMWVNEADMWVNKAIQLGYAPAAQAVYFSYSQGDAYIETDPQMAYYYNELFRALGGDARDSTLITERRFRIDGIPQSDKNGKSIWEVLVTEEEQKTIDKQVAEFVKDIKPNMFLDETSIDLF